MERRWKVRAEDDGARLDAWLCRRLSTLSRKRVKALIDAGCVNVGSRRVVIAGWKLAAGDAVAVASDKASPGAKAGRRPAGHAAGKRPGRRAAPEGRPKRKATAASFPPRRLNVYHADRDVIVVEKPAGILSVPQAGAAGGDDLASMVRAYLRRRYPESRQSFVGALHRLDAETSGVMAFALSRAGEKLESQFRNHTIKRIYVAIVAGALPREQGVIDRPLAKGEFAAGRKVQLAAKGEGVRAVTEYRVKERYRDASVVEVNVRTGRTHQIRVHLAAEGYPIIGDALYGSGAGGADLGFRRHALHASVLGFRHPTTGKPMLFRSPLPEDMRALIDRLRSEV